MKPLKQLGWVERADDGVESPRADAKHVARVSTAITGLQLTNGPHFIYDEETLVVSGETVLDVRRAMALQLDVRSNIVFG